MPKLSFARFVPHLGRHGRASRWKRARARPRVWAHRGDSAHAPENTLLAFTKAAQVGADGIELDVRFDADGAVIVFHDEDLQRLTGQPGKMSQTSSAARAALRVQGEPIPTLEEVLRECELEVDVEIKVEQAGRASALVEATAKVIKASGRMDQVCVSSFDPIALVQFHRYLPDIACGYIFGDDQPLPARKGWVGTWIGATLAHPQHTLVTAESIRKWHRMGMPVNTWTVDDPVELRRLAALGVDGVFSNDPAAALAVLTAP